MQIYPYITTGCRFTQKARRRTLAFLFTLLVLFLYSNAVFAASSSFTSSGINGQEDPFLDSLQHRTFNFFWDFAHPENGLIPDRAPPPSFSSIAAVGFGLTAYGVGVERGYIDRQQARKRVLKTLKFFWSLPHGARADSVAGYKGFYYHFLNLKQGYRYRKTELSTIDTGLLMGGVLFCQSYFDQSHPMEIKIRAYADSLYRRIEWDWMQPREPLISMGWKPQKGFLQSDYRGYNEAMLLYILALGSPTHPVEPAAWNKFTSTYEWKTFKGFKHVNFSPLFGHQYSHIWIDFRDIRDAYMRKKGIDYFENSRRATLANRAYCIDNPKNWDGYGVNIWGLTASDGPTYTTLRIDGKERKFRSYWARGASKGDIRDDGTIAPTAAGGSIPFTPEKSIRALKTMKKRYGNHLYGKYGFFDAFNPTFRDTGVKLTHGYVTSQGWFDDQYLGIDQGPVVLMVENYRSGLVWKEMKENKYIREGLKQAGFKGGWLSEYNDTD